MCGIVGYVGRNQALPVLIRGLKRLEYRGYDSAGIAYFEKNSIKITKSVGKIQELENKIKFNDESFCGIGHTRWATHGTVTLENCHPHRSGDVTIAHNGILENYQELRKILLEEGYEFQGETDSEVASAYIDYLYKKNKERDIISVLEECVSIFEGSYAIVGMIQELENQLFVMKKDSPLVIGIGKEEFYVSSDVMACKDKTNSFVFLNDLEVGLISLDDLKIYCDNKEVNFKVSTIEKDVVEGTSDLEFSHYMLKEIVEQIPLLRYWNQTTLEHFEELPNLKRYQKIHIVGCGTAYHAGLVGKYLLEQYGDIEVDVFISSEYRYQKLFLNKNMLVVFVSQSGETADTLACLKRVKEYGVTTLGIVNVENSSIARIVDEVIYTHAGVEVAVASTKAYLSQIYVFSLLAFQLGVILKKLNVHEVKQSYLELPDLIQKLLNYNYEPFVEKIWNKENMFYLGRTIDYVTMMEGALKLKEISYIHAEAFQAGELKHGTISLVESGTPVLALLSKKDIAAKTLSNVEEVKSRGAYPILLIRDNLISELHLDELVDQIIIPSSIDLLQPLLNVIPLQMIAYMVANKRGVDIDKPRNLAKSVTVE